MNGMRTETDVVVVGSGISGLAAGLTAAEGGAKVVIFEKQRSLGGSSNFLQGTFAVESEMQRERYICYTRDEAFKNLMDYSHWRANAHLVRAIVNESGPTISWLQRMGVEFTDATVNMPDAPSTYHVIKGEGAAMIKALASAAKEREVDIRLGARVQRLLKAGGKITGIISEGNHEEIEMTSKVVIIASGGYANNREWIKKYAGYDLDVNITPVGNVDKSGDGIRMAWEAGAAEEGMGVLELFRAGPLGPDFPMKNQIEFVTCQPDLWVNPRGERFCDEGISFYDSEVGNANARFKQGYTFSIFDDSVIERLLERGVDRGVAVENPPGTKPVKVRAELNAALERGSTDVFAADSLEELAKKIDIEPDILKATIEEYNRFCDKGHDELFAKNPEYLWPIKVPKFYAVKVRTVFLGTLGGIKINERTEVIDKKGNVMQGLYAVGYDAAGMWGDSYCFRAASGSSSGFAANSGRIAGKNALKYMGF
ncbi:MAG: FAD-dependent oxidoreductase [Deltaproteobacteria bacterium]|nr:FAD-dependent oxidoreductase [Deltaproteobacteria bacterium]